MLAVRWYLRYGLSYRDVEELLAERGIAVDHVTTYRSVQRFTPELIDRARPSRHAASLAFVFAMMVISLLAVMVSVPKHAATAAQT